MDPTASVRAGYDRWASWYDHDGNPLIALEEPVVDRMCGDVTGKRVIDLGCGTGRHALRLADRGASVVGVDFSEGMLAEARRKPGAPRVRFVAHDLRAPLDLGEEFDLLVSGLVLEHLPDLQGFFRQCRALLTPGGRAVISGMHPAMWLRGAHARFTDPASGEVVAPGSLPHSVSAFLLAASRAGLRVDDALEESPDAALAARFPRAERYIGWPMLIVLGLSRPSAD